MPRKGFVPRREVTTDSVFGSDLAQKFINSMMWDGKRSNAQRIFYGAMEQIAQKSNGDALGVFKKAVENVKPVLEVKTRRVGGANYQVPVEVNPFRRQSLAIRWLLLYARTRSGKTMTDKLAEELLDASNARGGAMKKKEDVQEGRRERQAGAGSQDAARGRRELPGSRGSESVPPAIAGHSLAAALRQDALG